MSSSESDSEASSSSDSNSAGSGTIKVPQLKDDTNNKKKRKAKEDGIFNLLTDTNNSSNDQCKGVDDVAGDGDGTFADKTLLCRECEGGFVFSAEEQEYHFEMGFDNAPVRCKECRAAKKQRMEELGEGGGGRQGENRGYSNRGKSCYNCGEDGHISRDCTKPRKEGAGGQVRSC